MITKTTTGVDTALVPGGVMEKLGRPDVRSRLASARTRVTRAAISRRSEERTGSARALERQLTVIRRCLNAAFRKYHRTLKKKGKK